MDPRNDRTSIVRSRLLNILSLRMQTLSSQSVTSKPPNSNVSPSLSSTEETAKGMPQGPSLPHIPPLNFGSSGNEEATRRALTPIVESSGFERDSGRLPSGGSPIASSPQQSNNVNDSASLSKQDRREELEVPNPTHLSSPSVYTPTEGPSAPVSPPHKESVESLPNAKLSPTTGIPLNGVTPGERRSTDDNRTHGVDSVSSPTSIRSSPSSATSPPSLSPANSSNPPASVSPGLVSPRTPSPKLSVLTSPHSMDSPVRPNQSFAEFGTEGSRRQSLTAPVLQTAPLEPSKLRQDSVQTSTDSSRDYEHGIYDEAGVLYYLDQFEQGSLDTNPLLAPEADEEDFPLEIGPPPISQITQPLRPKTTSPPPRPTSSGRSLPVLDTLDTLHRKPPIQPLPRTPTLDYGPERRPAGARAAPVINRQDTVSSTAQLRHNPSVRSNGNIQQESMSQLEDPDADAFVALTFLERHDDDAPVAPAPMSSASSAAVSPPPRLREEPPAIVEPDFRPQTPDSENAYKSSFAPSKNAMQRKARTEAQQAAHEAATHRPGRGKGKAKNKPKSVGAWGDSSEEEDDDDEEDEEDEDVDSDGQPAAPRDDRSVSNYAASVNQRSSRLDSPRGPSPLASAGDAPPPQTHPRPPRNLPPVPIPRGQCMSLSLLICMTSF